MCCSYGYKDFHILRNYSRIHNDYKVIVNGTVLTITFSAMSLFVYAKAILFCCCCWFIFCNLMKLYKSSNSPWVEFLFSLCAGSYYFLTAIIILPSFQFVLHWFLSLALQLGLKLSEPYWITMVKSVSGAGS